MNNPMSLFDCISPLSVNRSFRGDYPKGTVLKWANTGSEVKRAAALSATTAEKMNLVLCVKSRGHLTCS